MFILQGKDASKLAGYVTVLEAIGHEHEGSIPVRNVDIYRSK
jgi:hypothetical protein